MKETPKCERTCPHKRKLEYSTYFRCLKYDTILRGKAPEKCEKCIVESQPKPKRKKKEEYIEVK